MIRNSPLPSAGQALQPQEPRITLSLQLSASLRHLKPRITLLPEPYACCALFFTVAAEGAQDGVFFVRHATLEAAWREGTTRVRQWAWMRQLSAVELRIDWADEILVIGKRIPAPYHWGAASAWALADDDLEHAELIPPLAVAGASHDPLDAGLPQYASRPFPVLAEVNLLLRLQGLHVDRNGVQTELPAAPAPQRLAPRVASGTAAPFSAAHGAHCGRRCVSEALLLAQLQATDPAMGQAGLIPSMERAFACLESNTDGLHLRTDAACIEQAMCLLIFTGYVASRNTDGALTRLVAQMERLCRDLDAIKNAAMPDVRS